MHESIFQKTGLSLERLYSFCRVATAGGFNKAAGENTYKQSQYSKQIRDLEQYFGFPLFLRKGKTIELTSDGKYLLGLVNSFFAELGLLITAGKQKKIELIISAGESVIDFILPFLINEKVTSLTSSISFRNKRTEDAVEDVVGYVANLAIVSWHIKQKDIRVEKLLSSGAAMIVPQKNKSQFYVGDDIQQLAKNPTIMLEQKGQFVGKIIHAFGKAKINIALKVPSFALVKSYVAKGLGVSYVPSYCLTESDKQSIAVYTPKKLAEITRDLYLICRKNVLQRSETFESIVSSFAKSAQNLKFA